MEIKGARLEKRIERTRARHELARLVMGTIFLVIIIILILILKFCLCGSSLTLKLFNLFILLCMREF